jgi:Kef-type K+ transport system membrane component KefB
MDGHAIIPVLVLLGAGIVGVGLAKAARLSPLIGFFISGAIVGPHALGWIEENATVQSLAEAGVAFFLFEVGLHLPLKRFATAWKELFILGPLQVLFCTAGLTLVARLLGLGWPTAALVAVILSLSSTAVVLRLLLEHNEMTTPVGQRVASILVFQDLVAVILLALIAAFVEGEAGPGAILATLGKMTAGLIVVIALGRWLLQPFLGWVVRLEAVEVVTGAALFAVLSLAWLGSHANLSIPLGAFLAGVCLAESRYGYVVQAEIAPFRMLLLSLFFLTVGLGLDPVFVVSHLPMLLSIAIGMMLVKFSLTALSQRLAGVPLSSSVRSSALLAQGSEFAFIVASAGLSVGLLSNQIVEVLTTAVTLTLALTPLAGMFGCIYSRKLARGQAETETTARDDGEVIIVEFDEFAWELASILTRAQIRYRGHDRDWSRILLARSRGFEVHFSDPDRPRTLSRAASGLVRGLVILIDDHAVSARLLGGLRAINAGFPIVAATRDLAHFEQLQAHELTAVFIKNPQAPRLLAAALMEALHVAKPMIDSATVDPASEQAARAA